jgi:hypothetical protein
MNLLLNQPNHIATAKALFGSRAMGDFASWACDDRGTENRRISERGGNKNNSFSAAEQNFPEVTKI